MSHHPETLWNEDTETEWGAVTFDLDAELTSWPEPVRDAIELAYWQQVAEAAGWRMYRSGAGTHSRCHIFGDGGAIAFEENGPTEIAAARKAIAAAFSEAE